MKKREEQKDKKTTIKIIIPLGLNIFKTHLINSTCYFIIDNFSKVSNIIVPLNIEY